MLNVLVSFLVGPIAQSVEQRTFNPWVDGSSPSGPTILESAPQMSGVFHLGANNTCNRYV